MNFWGLILGVALACFFLAIDSLALNSNVISFLKAFSDLLSQHLIIIILNKYLLGAYYVPSTMVEAGGKKIESRVDVVPAHGLVLALEMVTFVKSGVRYNGNVFSFPMFLSVCEKLCYSSWPCKFLTGKFGVRNWEWCLNPFFPLSLVYNPGSTHPCDFFKN